mmetsp:Transcript_9822/g.19347  ORF Transcript_9822/g.19347 Transcript_9822/m.19347 type:complete len:95 (-) Transcript_9822:155-439(-)
MRDEEDDKAQDQASGNLYAKSRERSDIRRRQGAILTSEPKNNNKQQHETTQHTTHNTHNTHNTHVPRTTHNNTTQQPNERTQKLTKKNTYRFSL